MIGTAMAVLLSVFGTSAQDKADRGVRLATSPDTKLAIEGGVEDIVIHDVDRDGYPDLIVAVYGGPSLLFRSAKGRFEKPSWKSQAQGSWMSAALGDLRGTGTLDLVLVNYHSGRGETPAVVAYAGDGKGGFADEPFWMADDWSERDQANKVFVGDFNGDGHPDVLIAGMYGTMSLFPGSKNGPSSVAEWKAEHKGSWMARTEWVDLSGSGRRDLISACWHGPPYQIWKTTGKGFEQTPVVPKLPSGECVSLAVGDLDGDGLPEVAVGSITGRRGDGRVRLFANKGGVLSAEPVWMSADTDADAYSLIFADMNGDGRLDLVVVAGSHTAIHLNEGGRLSTQPAWRCKVAQDWGSAGVADLNKDGYPDLIVGDRKLLEIYYGGPAVPLVRADPFPALPELPALKAADLRPDLEEWLDVQIQRYREAAKAEERSAIVDELKPRAGEALGAVLSLRDPALEPLAGELRTHAETQVKALIPRLSDETASQRDEATRRLVTCGEFALPWLDESRLPADAELRSRARDVRNRIAGEAGRRMVAVQAGGFVFARITNALKKRYGLDSTEGVVLLRLSKDAQTLGFGNAREGDVLVGIGSYMDDGNRVELAEDPLKALALLVQYGRWKPQKVAGPAGIVPVAFQLRCGPLHPLEKGSIRKGRIEMREGLWDSLRAAQEKPSPWRPSE